MYYRLKQTGLVALALSLFTLSLPAFGQTTVFSNTPWSTGNAICVGEFLSVPGARKVGVAVDTLDMNFQVTSVALHIQDLGSASNLDLRLYSDNGGDWGSELATFGIQAGPGGDTFSSIEFMSAAPIALASGTVYWFVLTVPDEANDCAAAWGYDATIPAIGDLQWADAQSCDQISCVQRGPFFGLEVFGNASAAAPTGIPTLGTWGLLSFILLLAVSGGLLVRRYH